ncbi:acyltransferase domain-containing protein [Ditylenchus destructor]|nr:acyltransferase domain-containing protein [Ditylenchus destructor]
MMMLLGTTEHLLVLTAFAFPPVLITVLLVVVLATFGKSLGLRERYVNVLIRIFEWGAGEIRTTQVRRKQSQMFNIGGDDTEDEDLLLPERSEYCSLYSEYTNHDSGIQHESPYMTRSLSSSASSPNGGLRRAQNGSTSSLCSISSARGRHGSGHSIIRRDTAIHLDEDEYLETTVVNSRGWQSIKDSLYFMKAGVEAIIEDEVTSRFQAEQLASWNMLTRTSISFYQFVNWKLTLLWGVGFIIRYFLILPLRIAIFSIGMLLLVLTTALIGVFPNSPIKRWLNEKCMLMCYRILSRAVSALVYFHDEQNKAKSGGICVANHTSPIDVMILGTDNIYALIGQRHTGVLGLLQRALSRASSHIWFERSEARDRKLVTRTLREHVDDPHKLPILVFPEGTCINNTSVMMFKKGSFEVGAKIYPIAMKYDSRFGDAFWNSSEQSWVGYIMQMITSWAIICHVWYLPPMEKMENETGIDFANRVKKTIAVRGGLVDLEWDGQLKRSKAPPSLLAKQQEKYYQRYSRYTSCCEPPSLKGSDDSHSDLHSDSEHHEGQSDEENVET